MRKAVLNSPRLLELKKSRKDMLKKSILFSVIGFLVLMIFIVYLSRVSKLNISGIEVKGNNVIDTEEIKGATTTVLSQKYIYLFPKSNIFIYPKSVLKDAIENKFKRLTVVDTSVNKDGLLEIEVSERGPAYTWCGAKIVETTEKEKCFFLDKEGYIFDEAPYFSGSVYFKFYGSVDMMGDLPSGSYFFKNDFTKFINLKETLEKLGIKPVMFAVNDKDNAVFYLASTKIGTHPEVRIKLDGDINKMAENLEAALDTEPLKTDFVKRYDSLLYFDLRFGNKVYYKFK